MMELVWLLVWILIIGAACYGLMWVVNWMALPPPFAMIAKVIIGCVMLLLIVGMLTGYTPIPKLVPR